MKTEDKARSKPTTTAVTLVMTVIVIISIGVTAWMIMLGLDGRPGSPATQRDVDHDAAEQRLRSVRGE